MIALHKPCDMYVWPGPSLHVQVHANTRFGLSFLYVRIKWVKLEFGPQVPHLSNHL